MALSQMESTIYPKLIRNVSELVAAKPWMSLDCTDVFAIQDPAEGSEEVLFIQVSGDGEQEPFMLTAYRGARGLEILWELNNSPEADFVADLNFDVPALFVTYVPEEALDEKDSEALADCEDLANDKLGYPVFRQCKPGFQPSHPSCADLLLLSHVIRQTYEVVKKISQGTLNLEVEEGQEDDYYLRKPVQSDGGLAWEDARINMDLDEKLPKKPPKLKRAELATLKELPLGTRQLRMDLIVSEFTRDDSEEIPATFLFVVSDFESNDILAARIEEPGQKLVKFRDSLLTTFSDVVVRLGERPSTVHVELYSLCDIMGDTLAKTEIELSHHSLPPIRESEMEAINRRLEHRSEQEIVGASKIYF